MAEKTDKNALPKVTPEQRRGAAGQFERAQQVLATNNYEYGIDLLRKCCLTEPANLIYRQALRQAQKNMYKDNKSGQKLAFWRGLASKLRLQAAVGTKNYVKALEYGEEVLTRNPWDQGALLAVAEALEGLDLLDQALWTLDQARKSDPKNVGVNRRLAQVLEKVGNFTQAIMLWQLVGRADPRDKEAQQKVKDLSANETIVRGKYQGVLDGDVETPAAVTQKAEAAANPLGGAEDSSDETEQADQTERSSRRRPSSDHGDERAGKDIAVLEAKIQAHPRLASNYLHLANIHRKYGHIDRAQAVLEQGLVPTSNNFDIAIELVDLGIEPFRHNLEITDAKLRDDPDDDELRKIRGKLLKEINSRELDYFRQKSDRYPTDKGHHFEMGVRLLALDQVDEAIKELQTTRTDPRHRGKSLYYLGFCFKQRNNWRLAQRNFEEALQNLGPNDDGMRKELLFQLADGLAESGDLVRAFEVGCELADIDFAYKNIGTLIEEWQRREASGDG